jgi:hypothetical protein
MKLSRPSRHHLPVTPPQPTLSAVIHVADCLVYLIGSSFGWDSYAVLADAQGIKR